MAGLQQDDHKFAEQLRSLERVFEAVLDRYDEHPPEANAISSELRKDIIEQRFSGGDYGDYPYRNQFSRCISFLNTVCASLAAKQIGDLNDEKEETLREMYRFVAGPVRECARRVDPETDVEPDDVMIDRLTKEMHHHAIAAREAGLISTDFAYS